MLSIVEKNAPDKTAAAAAPVLSHSAIAGGHTIESKNVNDGRPPIIPRTWSSIKIEEGELEVKKIYREGARDKKKHTNSLLVKNKKEGGGRGSSKKPTKLQKTTINISK